MDGDKTAEHWLRRSPNKAGVRHHCFEQGRFREAADAFDEIAVALFVMRDDLSHARNDAGRVSIVDVCKSGPVTGGEFHAVKSPAALEDPIGFAKRRRDI